MNYLIKKFTLIMFLFFITGTLHSTIPSNFKSINLDEGIDPFSTINADSFDDGSGITLIANNAIGGIDVDEYVGYSNLNFDKVPATFKISAALPFYSSATVEVRLGSSTGTLVGECTLTPTGGFSTYSEFTCPVSGITTGVQDIYLVFRGPEVGGLMNMESFSFEEPTVDPFEPILADTFEDGAGITIRGDGTIGGVDVDEYVVYTSLKFDEAPGSFRVSAALPSYSSATVEVRLGSSAGTLVGECSLTPTGGFSTYGEFSCPVSGIPVGIQDIYLVFRGPEVGGLMNMASFSFVKPPIDPFETVDADTFNDGPGITPRGDGSVGGVDVDEYLGYTNLNFDRVPAAINITAALPSYSSATVEVRLGSATGTLVGECVLTSTGGFNSYLTFNCPVTGIAEGIQDIYLVFRGPEVGGLMNFASFAFEEPTVDPFEPILADTFEDGAGITIRGDGTIGGVDVDEYVGYSNLKFKEAPATFKISAALPSYSSATVEIRLNSPTGTLVGECSLSNTGGFNVYNEFSCTVSGISAGIEDIYLVFRGPEVGGLMNMGSFFFVEPPINAFQIIPADTFDEAPGITVLNTANNAVGGIDVDEYIAYTNLEFDRAPNTIRIEAGLPSYSSATIEIRLGSPTGTLVGECDLINTGGFNSYSDFSTPVTGIEEGIEDIYLVFKGPEVGGLMNMANISFMVREFDSSLGRVQVQNGTVVSDKGTLLRGVYVTSDLRFDTPTRVDIAYIKDFGLNAVHLYVECAELVETPGDHVAQVDRIVDWAGEEDIYVIMTIGGCNQAGSFDSAFVAGFWDFYAPRYKDAPHVVYEIMNEPFAWSAPYDAATLQMERDAYDQIRALAPETHVMFMSYSEPTHEQDALLDIAQLGTGIDWTNASIAIHGYTASSEQVRVFSNTIIDAGYAVMDTEPNSVENRILNMSTTRVFEEEFISYTHFISIYNMQREPSVYEDRIINSDLRWVPDYGTWPNDILAGTVDPFSSIKAGFIDEGDVILNGTPGFGFVFEGSYAGYYDLNFDRPAGLLKIEAGLPSYASGTAKIRLDSLNGVVIGNCTFTPTGGFTTFGEFACPVDLEPGVHDIFIEFSGPDVGGLMNVNSLEFVPGIEKLKLTSVCSDNPYSERRWRVRNPNPIPVEYEWEVHGTDIIESGIAEPGDNFFSTIAFDGGNTTIVSWFDEKGDEKSTVKASGGQACAPDFVVESLNLTSMCSDAPSVERRWRVRNPNAFNVKYEWQVHATAQKATLLAPPGDSFFFTNTVVGGANTTKINWQNETGAWKQRVKASGGAACSSNARMALGPLDDDGGQAVQSFGVYPNPAKGKLRIATDLAGTMSIYGLGGEEIWSGKVDNTAVIELGRLPKGLYLYKFLSQEGAAFQGKVVIE